MKTFKLIQIEIMTINYKLFKRSKLNKQYENQVDKNHFIDNKNTLIAKHLMIMSNTYCLLILLKHNNTKYSMKSFDVDINFHYDW